MRVSDLVKNAPNSLIYAVCFLSACILAAYVILTLNDASTKELWDFLNRAFNVLGAAFAGGTLIVAGSAAKSAQKAEQQTNGLSEAERRSIAVQAAEEALAARDAQDRQAE